MTETIEIARSDDRPRIGVVIVTFNSQDVIEECLQSLFASEDVDLTVVVADNSSSDSTATLVSEFASNSPVVREFAETAPFGHDELEVAQLTLLRTGRNGGYAFGVNRGLEALLPDKSIDMFWVLNPDCIVSSRAARAFVDTAQEGPFSLLGGRTVYVDPANTIQNDGGKVSRFTGVCHPVNLGRPAESTPFPDAESLDFITGANLVASREFVDETGLMHEDYFLYYEEVDWAFRRGSLPLKVVKGAVVMHHGGTSIGSGSISRRASAFSYFLNYRSRSRFMWRFNKSTMPVVLAYAVAKAAQLLLRGGRSEAEAVLRGAFNLEPPSSVKQRLPPALY